MSISNFKIICLTPVKNESWILEKFIKSTLIWADNIIIADQDSEDNSIEIANKFPKVKVIKNIFPFDECERQNLLIQEARKIEGNKILIALDADEIFTPEFFDFILQDKIKKLKQGTVLRSKFINITPDFGYYWSSTFNLPWGFIDNSSINSGKKIHNFRFPINRNTSFLDIDEIKIMHFQYTDWDRMESKHRWYQCWEKINNPYSSSVRRYRGYHHMYSIRKSELKELPVRWLDYYKEYGINLKEVIKDNIYYWDKVVLDYLLKYNSKFFAKESIWDIDWSMLAKGLNFKYGNKSDFKDPRTLFQKLVHKWLKKTQKNYPSFYVRFIDKILINLFKF